MNGVDELPMRSKLPCPIRLNIQENSEKISE